MKLATVEQMRGMDRYAIERLGLAEEILMENAAMASVVLLQRKIGIRGMISDTAIVIKMLFKVLAAIIG